MLRLRRDFVTAALSMTAMGTRLDSKPSVDYYDANYGNFKSELYAQIRREAFGDDIGQSSWLTADELDRFVKRLELSPSKVLLDIACGSGGPALRAAHRPRGARPRRAWLARVIH